MTNGPEDQIISNGQQDQSMTTGRTACLDHVGQLYKCSHGGPHTASCSGLCLPDPRGRHMYIEEMNE